MYTVTSNTRVSSTVNYQHLSHNCCTEQFIPTHYLVVCTSSRRAVMLEWVLEWSSKPTEQEKKESKVEMYWIQNRNWLDQDEWFHCHRESSLRQGQMSVKHVQMRGAKRWCSGEEKIVHIMQGEVLFYVSTYILHRKQPTWRGDQKVWTVCQHISIVFQTSLLLNLDLLELRKII